MPRHKTSNGRSRVGLPPKSLFVGLGVAAVGALSVWYTFSAAVRFSAFAASVAKVSLALLLFQALNRYWLEGIDTASEIESGNTAVAVALLALAVLLAPAVASGAPAGSSEAEGPPDLMVCDREAPAIVEVARSEIGAQEHPGNTGPAVEKYMAAVGLPDGYPWCAGFIAWVLDRSGAARPTVRSAVATDYITARSIDATDVLRGAADVPRGALSIHRRGGTWKGHIGVVEEWGQACGTAIEGNTSPPGGAGPDWDGGGVYRKERCIHPGNYFRIVKFTPTS